MDLWNGDLLNKVQTEGQAAPAATRSCRSLTLSAAAGCAKTATPTVRMLSRFVSGAVSALRGYGQSSFVSLSTSGRGPEGVCGDLQRDAQ